MAERAELAASLEPWGQEALQDRIRGAIEGGRLPQSLLLLGPEGVGKRLLALWVARALQCRRPAEGDGAEAPLPCGTCRSCRMAVRLEHPDIHLHFPMPRPKRAASKEKLQEEIEKLRHERLALLREDPHAQLDADAVRGLYVAAVRSIRHQASMRPSMSAKTVFIVEDADLMVPQLASPAAANAFLKLLEEPPEYTCIMLTSRRPDALLPTIRSRTVPLRVAPVATDRLASHLATQSGMPAEQARAVARRSGGAVYRALRLLQAGENAADRMADDLLAAALAGTARARYRAASRYSPVGGRGELAPALEELAVRLRDLLCRAADAPEASFDAERTSKAPGGREVTDRAVLAALTSVDAALLGMGQNLNPQATVALLLDEMSAAFRNAPVAVSRLLS